MQRKQLDWTIIRQPEHIQYLIGPRFPWTFQPLAALRADGHAILVAPEKRVPELHAADELHSYAARRHSTLCNDQCQVASNVLSAAIQSHGPGRRWGAEFSSVAQHMESQELIDIEPDLYRLRRRKDANELAYLRAAIQATEHMYRRAREIVSPGINELDVFNELQSVAVRHLGEPLTGTGNDYQCGSRGGGPRDRCAEAGELYILDLGPAYRGYFADNARTIAVTEPSPEQLEAWKYIIEVFDVVESEVRPGADARRLFSLAQEHLDRCPHGVFNHHLGHGIGLFPHEGPHLNPHWEDTFEVGDVFTAEPGLYSSELRAGIRIENDYLVTETGVERLTDFPWELKL